MTRNRTTIWLTALGSILVLALLIGDWLPHRAVRAQTLESMQSSGIIKEVVTAPIGPGGRVAGDATDLLINLDVSMDPAVAGWSLMAGDSIRVTLPDGFVNSGDPPLANVMSGDDCVPANLLCTTSVMLSGWPQRPIPPPTYDLSFEGNTLVITALKDLIADPPAAPGIKQIHLVFFNSFTNPEPGFYTIEVEAKTGPDGALETGSGVVEIIAEPIPHIAVTSVFNEGAPNTIYQHAAPGERTPYAYDFLLWNGDAQPMTGVTVEPLSDDLWRLVQEGRTVGIAQIDGPAGATGAQLHSKESSTEVNAPISKLPAGRLKVWLQTGSAPGRYAATFHLFGGNSVRMVADAARGVTGAFTRLPAESGDPNGNSAIANCDGAFEAAAATIAIDQQFRSSRVTVELTDARPDTFYTLWLRLRGTTEGDDGVTYGGSPITDAGSTPLAPSTALADLIAATEGEGSTDVANGFMTDADGNGATTIALDFPILGGAYPFHKADPTLAPVAIIGAPFAPFMVRVASHCTDNLGHGVNAGNREPWFDWSPQ